MENIQGFFAYPSKPEQLAQVIRRAIKKSNKAVNCNFKSWEENDIAGRPLTAPIFEGLDKSDVLAADITTLNFNVTFEVGYAIGIGRRIFLTKSSEYNSDDDTVNRIGIFDTLGYKQYANSDELADLISSISDVHPINTKVKSNLSTPVYLLETPLRSDIMMKIISRIKKARLLYRSFVPAEEARMSALDAIVHTASSYGVVIPLLSPNQSQADIHNIRAAFVAGLSLGFEIPTLILQDQNGPLAPLDVRDFVESYSHPDDIQEHIHNFSLRVVERIQETKTPILPTGNLLSTLTIGQSVAENEFKNLSGYYLQTHEFNRTLRGDVNLVVGRKGAGKSALFFQVRDQKRNSRNNVVVDLKPEGYQLLKLKEEILIYLTDGASHHLITAFWEYLLYLEICYKVLENDKDRHRRDHTIYDGYIKLSELYSEVTWISEGDFSERLQTLSNLIVDNFKANYKIIEKNTLTADNVTELLHATSILEIRKHLSDYLKHKNEIWILFDNLDKSWSSYGLSTADITILRCLIDASRKIQRELVKDKHEFHVVVFIRNDVYQLLMDKSPDFGKETKADLDWSDPELLREMIRMRLIQNDMPPEVSFEEVWNKICISHIDGEETSQFMIDRSLMRPRNYIRLLSVCRGIAVNMRHQKIEAEDIRKGLHSYSNDLLIDADQELTDIEPKARRSIYQFLGENKEFSYEDLEILLESDSLDADKLNKVVLYLLYYGFLGIKYLDDEQYIYDVGYNMEILKTRIRNNRKAISYVLNPAFWSALQIAI